MPDNLPTGAVPVDAGALEELQARARAGDEAVASRERERHAAAVEAAVRDGRIPPARRDDWVALMQAKPAEAGAALVSLPRVIPVGEPIGYSHGGDGEGADVVYDQLFGKG